MSLTKTYTKSGSKCKVTFRVPVELGGNIERAAVAGEFNGWDPAAAPMRKLRDGSFSLTMTLSAFRDYQFRYLLDDRDWVSDMQADAYVYCPYGDCENSVLKL
jgi:1,4-alpha-glucan branching enzyme